MYAANSVLLEIPVMFHLPEKLPALNKVPLFGPEVRENVKLKLSSKV